jgi:hypothetical protein
MGVQNRDLRGHHIDLAEVDLGPRRTIQFEMAVHPETHVAAIHPGETASDGPIL